MKYLNLKEFEFEIDTTEIISNNKTYELHNNADFIGYSHNIKKKEVELFWKYPSTWFIKEDPFKGDKDYLIKNNIKKKIRKISLKFNNVTFLKVSPRDPAYPDTEDSYLASIYIVDATNRERIGFAFQSEMSIEIEAESLIFNRKSKSKLEI
jgi:hypothetical protein